MIRILVVDDHKIFRQGIVSLLQSVEDVEVIAEAGSGSAALGYVVDLKPDVIIMDISLPDIDGIHTSLKIREAGITAPIILLTMHKESTFFDRALSSGISGYILKDDAFDDLLYGIRAVTRGERFISSSISSQLVADRKITRTKSIPLSKREQEIVILVAEGLTSKEIAKKLFISVKTVETHRSNITEKLDVSNVAEIVRYAIKTGLIQA